MPMSGADVLVHCLLQHGVRVVFAYPGGTSMPIHQALTKVEDRLRTILPRHEQGGGFAASAYARFTGQVGVCTATSGPGATNFVPCLADAMRHGVPLLAVTGQVHRPAIGTDAFQEIPIVSMCRWITKHHYQVGRPEDLTRVFREAFHLATTGRPGPVLVDVPKDVQVLPGVADFGAAMNLPGYQPIAEPAPHWCPPIASRPTVVDGDGGPTPQQTLSRLARRLRRRGLLERAVITSGPGPEQDWLARSFPFADRCQWLTTDSGSAEGYALPAALGVLAAEPGRPVIAVTTPDNLLVNLHELASAFCEKLPVKVLLLNHPSGQAQGNLDYVQLSRGFRGLGRHLSQAADMDDALDELLAARGPYLLDVAVTARAGKERALAAVPS